MRLWERERRIGQTIVGKDLPGFYGDAAVCETECLVGLGQCVAGWCLSQDAADETRRCGE